MSTVPHQHRNTPGGPTAIESHYPAGVYPPTTDAHKGAIRGIFNNSMPIRAFRD